MARQYADRYTWSHPFGPHAVCHTDGAVSVAIGWNGIDAEMITVEETTQAWVTLYTMLGSLGLGYCAEFHFWRERDSSLAAEYLAHNDKIIRGHEVAIPIRAAMAEHLAPYGMTNKVALVLTRMPEKSLFLGAKRALVKQGQLADELLSVARAVATKLPGGQIKTYDAYADDIIQSVSRDVFLRGHKYSVDPRFLLKEQLLRVAPRLEATKDKTGSRVRHGKQLSKVLVVTMHPTNPAPAWFVGLATSPIAMHVSQIVIPANTKQSLRDSEGDSDHAEGTLGKRGRSEHVKSIKDMADFQSFVANNKLGIFKNAYIIHLHGTEQELETNESVVADWIEECGGQVRDESWLQLPYFRAAQPGQGYRCPKFRPDHTWQVANMAPVQVYKTGERNPESLRLGASSALIGFGTSSQEIPHSFTVAMTGAGKGVSKVAQIVETYPFGIDWYISEIGGSYRWVVESFGGVYSVIDPNNTVVNPLPPYSVADMTADWPLDAKLAGGTINALSFLLTDGKTEMPIHHASAAQWALQGLYAAPPADRKAPTLGDLLVEIESMTKVFDDEPRQLAAKEMAQNLGSFLETTEGRIFTRQDNLVLSEGITGVDLKEVDRASPKLLKFYLVFLALRFNHLAFARRNPARVLLDEMHKPIAVAPEVIGKMISELARMGRKDAAAIDLVTQGIAEIDVVEKEVLNSMPLRTLLYRSDEWDYIANRINMPKGPLEVWKRYPFFKGLPYRQAIQSVGPDYYDLHLTFPSVLLDLSATGPEDLDLKDKIGVMTKDPLERLRLFRDYKEGKLK